jgi:hypothetical protein
MDERVNLIHWVVVSPLMIYLVVTSSSASETILNFYKSPTINQAFKGK